MSGMAISLQYTVLKRASTSISRCIAHRVTKYMYVISRRHCTNVCTAPLFPDLVHCICCFKSLYTVSITEGKWMFGESSVLMILTMIHDSSIIVPFNSECKNVRE